MAGQSGTAADEQRELAALRRRAYGPDADIFDDPDALARLSTLEDRMRLGRAPSPEYDPAELDGPEPVASALAAAAREPVIAVTGADPPAARAPRWHARLVTGTAIVAVVLGATAWTASQSPTDGPPSADAKAAAIASERRAAGYEESYGLYLDGLREEVLTLPGGDDMAERMIRDQLRPYGVLYGRTVGAGPTIDDRFCMIVANLPQASVTCIPIENADADPVSVVLPSWYSDAESDLFTGLGEPISYTLMPGGGVVAVPADSAEAAAAVIEDASVAADSVPVLEAPAPTPTATPPPGWQ